MDRLSAVTLGDITAGLRRYWPVALTVAVIVLMAAVLPGERPGDLDELSNASAPAPVKVVSGSGADAAATDAAAVDPSLGGGGVSSAASFDTGSSFALGPSANFGGSSNSATTFRGNEDAAAPDAAIVSSPDSGSGFGSGSGSSSSSSPLRITASLYATNGAGTPLATQDVPEGSLPVGKRLGQEDKRSYVRLAGTQTELRLSESGTGRSTGNSVVAVQACRVTAAGWSEGRGVALSAAPAFDANACVKGQRATDGVWSFDLSPYPDRTDAKGFALVVAPDSGVDFQVNFTEIVI